MKLIIFCFFVLFSTLCFGESSKYLLEIDLGKVLVPDDKSLTFDDDPNDNEGKVLDRYNTTGMISISGGMRLKKFSNEDMTVYALVKVKHFKGNKIDYFQTNNIEIKYSDFVTSVSLGPKLVFFPLKQLHLTTGLYLGYGWIQSNLEVQNSSASASVESSGFGLTAEVGVEYMFNNNFGLGLTTGYEYLGKREFEAKSKNGALASYPIDKFKSQMSYSNIYALAGLKIYFSN